MSRSFVNDAVVATLERLGRGSCADIERWGGIAEGHLGAGLRAERGATCAKAPPIPGDGCEGQSVRR